MQQYLNQRLKSIQKSEFNCTPNACLRTENTAEVCQAHKQEDVEMKTSCLITVSCIYATAMDRNIYVEDRGPALNKEISIGGVVDPGQVDSTSQAKHLKKDRGLVHIHV